jgi:hypothetical protein
MPSYPNSGSILDSKTRTGLSTQIIIMVDNEPVGAVQRFSASQNRPTKTITEIGTDGVIEIVPSGPTSVSLTLERIVFDGLSLPEAFSRGFRNIAAQRISFDIVVIDQYTGTGEDAVITTYHGCWFKSMERSFSAGDYVLSENASCDCEYVSTVRAGEAAALSQGIGGARQIPGIRTDEAELAADSGQRRGALDFPGLISAAY